MREVNEFVNDGQTAVIFFKDTKVDDKLSKIVDRHNRMSKECDKNEKELKPYLDKIKEENGGEYVPTSELEATQDFYEMYELYKNGKLDDFYQEYKLYQACDYLIYGYKRGKEFKAKGIDLEEIKRTLTNDKRYKMSGYVAKTANYDSSLRAKYDTYNSIIFPYSDERNPICDRSRHLLIKLPNEIKCVYCGFTTKEFKLSKDQIEFLAKAAEHQNILLTDATENDLPFIEIVKAHQEEEMNGLLAQEEAEYAKEDEEEIDDYTGLCGASETSSYINERSEEFAVDMKRAIELAHRMDREDYYDEKYKIRYNPVHLTEEETKNYMKQVENELERATTEFDIASLTVKKYEILILSGKSISKLFDEIEDPINKGLFVKAYTNLQRESYREECEFFDTTREGSRSWERTCTTANPELNKMLLKANEKKENKGTNK